MKFLIDNKSVTKETFIKKVGKKKGHITRFMDGEDGFYSQSWEFENGWIGIKTNTTWDIFTNPSKKERKAVRDGTF